MAYDDDRWDDGKGWLQGDSGAGWIGNHGNGWGSGGKSWAAGLIGALAFVGIPVLKSCEHPVVLHEAAQVAGGMRHTWSEGIQRGAGAIDKAASESNSARLSTSSRNVHYAESYRIPSLHPRVNDGDDPNAWRGWHRLKGETIKSLDLKTEPFLGSGLVQNPKLLAAFPTNITQFEIIYERAATAANVAEMRRLSQRLSKGTSDFRYFDPASNLRQELT